ncbi:MULTISPECIES: hypothetical protein [unclassified Microcoleus]|uniref:hypothetical protein n=1 Tax=unclassified Microcoleus TaxID=2642155 RepID=UPI002FD137C9
MDKQGRDPVNSIARRINGRSPETEKLPKNGRSTQRKLCPVCDRPTQLKLSIIIRAHKMTSPPRSIDSEEIVRAMCDRPRGVKLSTIIRSHKTTSL